MRKKIEGVRMSLKGQRVFSGTFSTTSSACSLSGSALCTLVAGNCKMTATQAANSTYKGAVNVSRSYAISQAGRSILLLHHSRAVGGIYRFPG
jgi:hypothetical protein